MTLYGTPRPTRHRPPRRVPWLACAAVVLAATLAALVGWYVVTARTDAAHLATGQAALGRVWNLQIAAVDVPALPAPGGPIGRMWLPRLGLDWVLVEGVSDAALAAGPGHYPDSAMPGQRGNFAVAGHRSGGMWIDLDRVQPGDLVIVQGRKTWWTYRVTATRVVAPTDLAEVAPVPPGMTAGRLLTLTTCWPRLGNSRRLVVHAALERTTPADEPPPEVTP